MVYPQLWPHSHLSLFYISKEKKYDELTLAEFAAGYAAILQRPNLPPQELHERIVHLSSFNVFGNTVHLGLRYAIFMLQSFLRSNVVILVGGLTYSFRIQDPTVTSETVSDGASSHRIVGCSFLCKLTKDHYGTLRERKWLQHICSRCWADTHVVARHTEFSKECPFMAEKVSIASEPTTSP